MAETKFVYDATKDEMLSDLTEGMILASEMQSSRLEFLKKQQKALMEEVFEGKKVFWKKVEARLNELELLKGYNDETDAISFNEDKQFFVHKNQRKESGLDLAGILGSLLK